ncbi:MAG TPA: TRAP transporter small permease [Casimicrobiaceae bacterium]|nr:TRAP transporter small permease [Casimicrobiaceae bacterium]
MTEELKADAQAGAGGAHVIDASGHVHLRDEPIDLSPYPLEAWAALVLFFVLGLVVFYQFFTRYFLNDSAGWTEEIARYLLIATVWMGIAAAVRLDRHIHVDFLYHFLPRAVGRALATLVNLVEIAFFGYASVLTVQLMQKMANYRMTIVDLPMNLVYGACLVGFACAFVRAVQIAWRDHRRGYSALERHDSENVDASA